MNLVVCVFGFCLHSCSFSKERDSMAPAGWGCKKELRGVGEGNLDRNILYDKN